MGELYAPDGPAVNYFFQIFKILVTVVENCPGLWYNTREFQ